MTKRKRYRKIINNTRYWIQPCGAPVIILTRGTAIAKDNPLSMIVTAYTDASPNFMVWKFCGNAQLWPSFGQIVLFP